MQGSLLLNGRVENTKLKDLKVDKIIILRIENLCKNEIHSSKMKCCLNVGVYSWPDQGASKSCLCPPLY